MIEKCNFNQIMKTLEKLFNAGFNTEKKILAMRMEDLEQIENLVSNEVIIIIEFKKAIKNKKIIEFFAQKKEGE